MSCTYFILQYKTLLDKLKSFEVVTFGNEINYVSSHFDSLRKVCQYITMHPAVYLHSNTITFMCLFTYIVTSKMQHRS